MNAKTKKGLIIAGLAVDFAITMFLFVLSIILLAKLPDSKFDVDPNTFLGWFHSDPIRILIVCVIPLVVLLIVNVVALWMYVKKNMAKKPVKLEDLSEEQKELLRQKIAEELASKNEK